MNGITIFVDWQVTIFLNDAVQFRSFVIRVSVGVISLTSRNVTHDAINKWLTEPDNRSPLFYF